MRSLDQCRLYGILDLGYVASRDAVKAAERMLAGGIDILQLRAKNLPPAQIEPIACQLLPLTRAAGTPLIINDHPEIAVRTGADGVHLGQDDLPIHDARRFFRGEAATGCNVTLLGRSTHSRDQAFAAAAEGADYIGFGPLFTTPTKPDYTPIGLHDIAWVHKNISIPIFCIGGIKKENLNAVIDAGATRVVIVSGILQADNIEEYIRLAKSLLPSLP